MPFSSFIRSILLGGCPNTIMRLGIPNWNKSESGIGNPNSSRAEPSFSKSAGVDARCYRDVKVLCITRPNVVHHGVTTRHEVPNLQSVECSNKIDQVGVHQHFLLSSYGQAQPTPMRPTTFLRAAEMPNTEDQIQPYLRLPNKFDTSPSPSCGS